MAYNLCHLSVAHPFPLRQRPHPHTRSALSSHCFALANRKRSEQLVAPTPIASHIILAFIFFNFHSSVDWNVQRTNTQTENEEQNMEIESTLGIERMGTRGWVVGCGNWGHAAAGSSHHETRQPERDLRLAGLSIITGLYGSPGSGEVWLHCASAGGCLLCGRFVGLICLFAYKLQCAARCCRFNFLDLKLC